MFSLTSQFRPNNLFRRFYQRPARNQQFKQLSKGDLDFFQQLTPLLATPQIGGQTDPQELAPYNHDWLNKYHGASPLVLKPRTTQQVSDILRYCSDRGLAVVPQGGNTGLVGGSVPVYDEVVLNLGNLNKIRAFDSASGILTCDAGCVLEDLDNHVGESGYRMPLDLGAKGSCQIGGNLATNAGGIRFLRYGSLHGSVLGIEAVMADGTVLDNLNELRKDNTGYDLKQLFIGSEGTLGAITGVSMVCPTRPSATNVAVLGLPTYEAVQRAFGMARRGVGEILSAYEFWDQRCMGAVEEHLGLKNPLSQTYPFYVLVETSGSNKDHDDEKLTALLERVMEDGLVEDGVLAQDQAQIARMWMMREGIPESLGRMGATYKYDISVPLPALYQVVGEIAERLRAAGLYGLEDSPVKLVCGYGHIGDGNLHLNVVASEFQDRVTSVFEPFVYEWVKGVRGSISAEHGVGLMKKDYLAYSKSPQMIGLMRRIKHLFDPQGIMNPYKVL